MFNEFQLNDLGQDAFEFDDKLDSMSGDYGMDDGSMPEENFTDDEGAMAKADLLKLAKYSYKLFKKINDDDQLEAWVQAKITKAADYIASVYHYLEYEMEFSEYGKRIENSDMYTESQKRVLKNKLMEAKQKLAKVKIEQAKKAEETEKQIAQKSKSPAVKKPTVTSRKSPVSKNKELDEAKSAPSAGMTKTQKSSLVKKARAGEDIGKPGKGFAKVEKAAEKGGAKDPKAVAAAAMWKTAKKKALKEDAQYIDDPSQQPEDTEEFDLQEAQHMTYHTTILNPNLDMEDPEGQEEIDVTVEYSVFGDYSPGSREEPPEYPEVEIIKVTDDRTSEDVEIDERTARQLEDEILNQQDDDVEGDYERGPRYYDEFGRYSESSLEEVRGEEDNFTSDDIKQLEKIRDLETLKARAIDLISTRSKKAMKPEKLAILTRRIDSKKRPMDIIELMYDLLLRGEGHGVIGSRDSMNPNSWQRRFGENINESTEVNSILKLAGLKQV